MNIHLIEELLEPIFSHVYLPILMTCTAILTIIMTIGLYLITIHWVSNDTPTLSTDYVNKIYTNPYAKRHHSKKEWTFKFLYSVAYFIVLSYATISIALFHIAYQHCYREYMKQDIKDIIYSVKHSPVEDILPDNLTNATIIYYRFGCHDCNKIDNQLQEKFKNSPNTYWVATRSEQGKKLRKDYPVESVPSAIYIDNQKIGIVFDLKTQQTINGKISTSVNEQNVNELIHIQNAHDISAN